MFSIVLFTITKRVLVLLYFSPSLYKFNSFATFLLFPRDV